MPRQARINFSGALHHVMIRRHERYKIFKDKKDYEEFLTRLDKGLEKSGCQCHAWALMPNHVHLLVRPGEAPPV